MSGRNRQRKPKTAEMTWEEFARLGPVQLMQYATRDWPSPYIPARHNWLMNDALLDVAAGKTPILVASVAVQHSKTVTISRAFSAYFVGMFPDKNVGILSFNASMAIDNVGRPTRELCERVWKPVFGIDIDRRSNASDRWSVAGRKGGIYCGSVEKGVEGRSFDLIIADDVVGTDVDAMNPAHREWLWESWYKTQVITRFAPGGSFVAVQSRWSSDDLIGRLITAGVMGQGAMPKILDLPALALNGAAGDVTLDSAAWQARAASRGEPIPPPRPYVDALGRAPGEPLWPEVRSLAFLEDQRRSMRADKFLARFQGRPVEASGTLFRRSDFRYFDWSDETDLLYLYNERGETIRTYTRFDCYMFQTCDLATSLGKDSDYFVILAAARLPQNELCIVDVVRTRVEGTGHVDLVERTWQKWRRIPKKILVEGGGYQSSFVQRLLATNMPVEKTPRSSRESKELRAGVAATYYAAHKVYHRRNAEWLGEFELELVQFPHGKFDDQCDCLADSANFIADHSGQEAYGVRVG